MPAQAPPDDSDVTRPSTASSGVLSRNRPCIGVLWDSVRYGSARSAWNSCRPRGRWRQRAENGTERLLTTEGSDLAGALTK